MSVPIIVKGVASTDGATSMYKQLHITPKVKTLYDRAARRTYTPKAPETVKFFLYEDGVLYAPRAIARQFGVGPYSENAQVRALHASVITPKARIPAEYSQFTSALRPAQQEAMREADAALAEETGCIFRMRPGFGKTVCAAYQIARLALRALVLCNRTNLLDQWINTFKNMTKLRVTCWDANAKRRAKQVDWENVDVVVSSNRCMSDIPRSFLDSVGTLVVDEAHLFCTPGNVPVLLSTMPEYAIACTATPEREDGMHEMIYQVFGTRQITALNDVPYKLYRVDAPFRPSTGDGPNIDWTTVVHSLVACGERNRAIVRLAAHLARLPLKSLASASAAAPSASGARRKVLILTRMADHVETLEKMLNDEGVGAVATLYRDKRSYRDAPILIGTMSKISVGFDEANACEDEIEQRIDALILVTSIKDKGSIEQTFGRAFRSKNPEIYYFVDALPTIERHWKNAVDYAKNSHGTVCSFDLTPFLDPE